MNKGVFAISALVALAGLVLLAGYAIALDGLREPGGMLAGRDFGRLIAEGRQALLFDGEAYMAFLRGHLGADYSIHNFSYPPLAYPLAELAGRSPYGVALAVWTLGGALLLAGAGRACPGPGCRSSCCRPRR